VTVTLPIGTVLKLSSESSAATVRAAFVNALESPKPETRNSELITRAPLKLSTPAYFAERDAAELQLMKRIEELKLTK